MTASPLNRRTLLATLGATGVAATAAACSNADPTANNGAGEGSGSGSDSGAAGSGTIVVGSQAYYSNEVIAELFAQVLENAGLSVDRQYQIGQREVYLAEVEVGSVNVIPEYSGALLQYYDPEAASASQQEIYDALSEVLPDGLEVLDFADATDQDSYVVTAHYSEENKVTSLEDVAALGPVKIVANSEIENRPYGPQGLKDTYGIDATVVPVEDSGGPLTVKAIMDGTGDLANVYTASPLIAENSLVELEDPASLFFPQNVTPLVTSNVDETARDAINGVIAKLTQTELVALNAKSVDDSARSAEVAKEWLTTQGLLGE